MKDKDFQKELEKRLRENRELVEHQFLPQRVFPVAAFVGTHLFYVLLLGSLIMALVTTRSFKSEIKIMETLLLFL